MRTTNQTTRPRIIVLLLTMLCTSAVGKTIYVDDDATGANNGSSWEDAYNYLQDALMTASAGDDILVAQGIYKPDQFVLSKRPGQSRMETFWLKNDVAIRGGYSGLGEPNANERNVELYETILSGDLTGNDIDVDDPCDLLNEPTRSENSYHVVTTSMTYTTAVLDGFTITAGSHHGLYNQSGSPTVINCKFSGNRADRWGGGMFNDNGSPRLSNCKFSGNSAKYGGGIWNSEGAPVLTECTFSGNSAQYGGGMCNYRSSPILSYCTFTGNSARWGGGMSNDNNSNPNLINCTFSHNQSLAEKLNSYGSGIYNKESNPTLTNCTFNGNNAQWGGGMFNENSNPILINCTFSGNIVGWGGGLYNRSRSNPMLTNCIFSGNQANCWGGGICNSNSRPCLSNCTFSRNSAPLGGGIYSYSSEAMLINCILWGNIALTGPQIHDDGAGSANVSYCDVQGGYTGINNINTDPMFVDIDGTDDMVGTIDDNLRLSIGSPCINAGDNSTVPVSLTTDISGNPRVVNGVVDIGAYEWIPRSTASGENVKVSAVEAGTTVVFDVGE